jgi:hypothetical protein
LGPRPDFYYCHTVTGLLLWGALSDERKDLPFTIAAGPRQLSHSRFEFDGTHDHILVSQIRDSPSLEGQVLVFISPRNRVAQSYPQALGSLFVASCGSHGPHRNTVPLVLSVDSLPWEPVYTLQHYLVLYEICRGNKTW